MKRKTVVIAIALAVLTAQPIFSWGYHYLVTDRALENSSMAFAAKEVEVKPLESFVTANGPALEKLFKEYYKWLGSTGQTRFNFIPFDGKNPTLQNFIRTTRLNKKTKYPLVNRLLPGEKAPAGSKMIPFKQVSQYLTDNGKNRVDFYDVTGKKVSIRSIIYTFSDEPDWGLDHYLFNDKEYGYGEQPYGKAEGESSKAPFHMLFRHENFLVRTFASNVTEGMVHERLELFVRLAMLAKEQGHEYWAWRFMSWGLHYIQDLGQPYHSKAVPFAGGWYYTKFIFSLDKAAVQERTTQLLANRHFVYEDFVSVSLEKAYISDEKMPLQLAESLQKQKSPLEKEDIHSAQDLMEDVMEEAVDHASTIDSAICDAFGEKITDDPKYDLETDKNYRIGELIKKMPHEEGQELLNETRTDFALTGEATRILINMLKNHKSAK